jgi:choline kinase
MLRGVIYNAGIGSRFCPGEVTLKSLLKISGKTIISHQIDRLLECKVTELVIVIGLEHEAIVKHVGELNLPLPVVFLENPYYRTHGNMMSFYVTSKLSPANSIFTTGDFMCCGNVLGDFLNNGSQNKILVDDRPKYRGEHDDPVRVQVKNGRITRLSKNDIMLENQSGVAPGFYQFSAEANVGILCAIRNRLTSSKQSLYYAFDDILPDFNVTPSYVPDGEWWDIDSMSCYENVKGFIQNEF